MTDLSIQTHDESSVIFQTSLCSPFAIFHFKEDKTSHVNYTSIYISMNTNKCKVIISSLGESPVRAMGGSSSLANKKLVSSKCISTKKRANLKGK